MADEETVTETETTTPIKEYTNQIELILQQGLNSISVFGLNVANTTKDVAQTVVNNTSKFISDLTYNIENNTALGAAFKTVSTNLYNAASDLYQEVKLAGDDAITEAAENSIVDSGSWYNTFMSYPDAAINNFAETAASWLDGVNIDGTGLSNALVNIGRTLLRSLKNFEDGVSETSFGAMMQASWSGQETKSFLNYFQKANKTSGSYKINILNSTPLDSGSGYNALFGSLVLGVPYSFNQISDPNNRMLINSFVKDSRILSLTPGLPKYYGSQYIQDSKNSIYKQTENPNDMLTYLLKNGIDKTFSEKDKRFYTFQAKYKEYFAYLETMLNPIWIKLGLANGTDSKTFNIFSFFQIKGNGEDGFLDPSRYDDLIEQYNSSIGFFLNPSSAVSESVSSSKTGTGSELKGTAETNSDYYQKLNYITGMGTGGATRNVSRSIAIGLKAAKSIGGWFAENMTMAQSLSKVGYDRMSGGKMPILKQIAGWGIGFAAGAALDITRINAEQDWGSLIQQFATTNGMKVEYPELWSDSSYTKSISFNLSFVSPYGDPLSIFKYVYVPFCSLLCFALPRQADANGYVSPFFVRADIPGLFTTDLGLITDITWTKGGGSNLWTKDGLPRAIDCSITISDLYEYLAMTKRLSFLSANPSYTVFLDNMAGLCALNDNVDDDAVNDYFKEMLNRVSGEVETGNNLWNTFNTTKRANNYKAGNSKRSSVSANVGRVPWIHNSSIN